MSHSWEKYQTDGWKDWQRQTDRQTDNRDFTGPSIGWGQYSHFEQSCNLILKMFRKTSAVKIVLTLLADQFWNFLCKTSLAKFVLRNNWRKILEKKVYRKVTFNKFFDFWKDLQWGSCLVKPCLHLKMSDWKLLSLIFWLVLNNSGHYIKLSAMFV